MGAGCQISTASFPVMINFSSAEFIFVDNYPKALGMLCEKATTSSPDQQKHDKQDSADTQILNSQQPCPYISTTLSELTSLALFCPQIRRSLEINRLPSLQVFSINKSVFNENLVHFSRLYFKRRALGKLYSCS